MSITYLNSRTSSKESFIAQLKRSICSTWKVKEKFTGDINELSVTFGGSTKLLLPMACAFDQYVLKVPASFNYKYITVLANDTVITVLLSNDKCVIGNDQYITLPIRYIASYYISDAFSIITHDGEFNLSERTSTATVRITPSGIYSSNPVVPIFNNYDMQSPNTNYKFYKNCELDDFTIVKV